MKGQDILIMLKLLHTDPSWTYQSLANELGMSVSEIHGAVKRCEESGLYEPHARKANRTALHEVLVHAARYVFPAKPGPICMGLPTSYAASPLREKLSFDASEAPVMPLVTGSARGPSIAPLCRHAPQAAQKDPELHTMLSLVDALRTGRARERKLAGEYLSKMLLV
jgi:hypothetical protein